jgi:hypothetical protein
MRILKFKDFISEKAIPLDDLILPDPRVGLVVKNRKSSGRTQVTLVLYNFDNMNIR